MSLQGRTHAANAIIATLVVGLVFSIPFAAGCAPAPEKSAEAPGSSVESSPAPEAPAVAVDGVVEITVDGTGFHPARIAGHAGQPLTLALTRTTDETCGTEIVMPALGIDTPLPLNERVLVTVTPADTADIEFRCAMDMLKGTIVVD